jgi:hypothetical protein
LFGSRGFIDGSAVFVGRIGNAADDAFDEQVPENRAVIDANFGASAIWYPIVGNHETETGADMQWVRNEYDNGNNVRTPLKNYTNQDGPTGTVRTNYSWDCNNAHFIALNEYWDGGTNGSRSIKYLINLYFFFKARLVINASRAAFIEIKNVSISILRI